MTEPRTRSRPGVGGTDESLGMYGIVWLGLLAAIGGVLIGVIMMFREGEWALLGAAAVAVSIALGALLYLVSKVLDRL